MRPAILALADESGHAKQRSSGDSVSAQHQRLDGKQQGLDAQQHRMHEADGVDGMQHKTLECATIPTFMTCASICPNPAESVCRPAPSGMMMPADRIMGLTISPTRNANCSTRPSTPART